MSLHNKKQTDPQELNPASKEELEVILSLRQWNIQGSKVETI